MDAMVKAAGHGVPCGSGPEPRRTPPPGDYAAWRRCPPSNKATALRDGFCREGLKRFAIDAPTRAAVTTGSARGNAAKLRTHEKRAYDIP